MKSTDWYDQPSVGRPSLLVRVCVSVLRCRNAFVSILGVSITLDDVTLFAGGAWITLCNDID